MLASQPVLHAGKRSKLKDGGVSPRPHHRADPILEQDFLPTSEYFPILRADGNE